MKKYNTAACGGTFDHFHKGHKSFLEFVCGQANKVVIGITSDLYVQNNKKKFLMEPFLVRKEQVEKFLNSKGYTNAHIVEIHDVMGPLVNSDDIDVLIITQNTEKNVLKIQEARKANNKMQVAIVKAPFVLASDGGVISSTRIRAGEIDRNGKVYVDKRWLSYDLILPDHVREEFRKPFGTIYKSVSHFLKEKVINENYLVSVGDISTHELHTHSIRPVISIVDFNVERKKKFNNLAEIGFLGNEKTYEVENMPGVISHALFQLLKDIVQDLDHKTTIRILGEEDLSVLPLILVLPLGYMIIYGQPGQGIVQVEVNEESKRRAHSLASKMSYL